MVLFLILILVYVLFSKFYLKNDLIKLFGNGGLIVVTGSMEPTIHIKEFIIIKEQDKYKINDIVTYRDQENNFVTHRIIDIDEKQIITRGDNNTVNDEPISIESVEGKVIFHSVVLGELFLYWLKPVIFFMFLFFVFNFMKYSFCSRKVENNEEANS